MAAYPTLTTSVRSTRAIHSGLQMDQAEDGTLRGRTLYSSSYYEFTVVHERVDATDRDSVLSHFASNLGAAVSYTWPDDSAAYTVYYAAAPQVVNEDAGRYTVTTRLVGRPT